jgi:hypothetical protein
MERRGRTGLTNFEKLIRDAIALLIERGEIEIRQKKRPPQRGRSANKEKSSTQPFDQHRR